MLPIAALLSRLLASRLGSAAAKAASGLQGMGGLAKPTSKQAPDPVSMLASAFGSRNEPKAPPRQPDGLAPPRKQPESGGMLGRTVRHVVNFAGGLMGRLPADEPSEQAPRSQPQQSPRAAAIRSSGSGLGTAALGLAMKHPVAAAGLLAGVFASVAVGAKRLGEAQAEGLKHLRAYNGQIAAAYARMSRSDVLRTRQQAAATAGSTSAVVDAVAEMRDAWAPVENVVTNIKNNIGTAGAKLFEQIGTGLSALIAIGEKVGIIAKAVDKPKAGPWQQSINDLAAQYRDRNAPKKPALPVAPPKGGKRR